MKERPDVIGRENYENVYSNDYFLQKYPILHPNVMYLYSSISFFQFEHAMIFRVHHVGMYPISHPAQKVAEVESRNEA